MGVRVWISARTYHRLKSRGDNRFGIDWTRCVEAIQWDADDGGYSIELSRIQAYHLDWICSNYNDGIDLVLDAWDRDDKKKAEALRGYCGRR